MPSHNGAEGGRRVGQKVTHYIIPDGRFATACEALMTQSFRLSWFDRFPPERPVRCVRVEQQPLIGTLKTVAVPPTLASGPVVSGPAAAGADPEGRMVDAGSPLARGFPPAGLDDDGDDFLLRAGLIELPDDTVNRSLRVRFRCPSCGSLAWGKPSLKILCGQPACGGAPFIVGA